MLLFDNSVPQIPCLRYSHTVGLPVNVIKLGKGEAVYWEGEAPAEPK